VPNISVG